MLDKYQSFHKLTSGQQCTLYAAFNRLTAQSVLLKRTHQWNQILTHKQLTLTSKNKIFPKLSQIFRHKGFFFFVFQKPYGNSLSPESPMEKQSLQTVIQLLSELLLGLKQLAEIVPQLVVLCDWIFFHRNSLKIVHYQPFMEPEGEEKQHIVTFDSSGLSSEDKGNAEIWPEDQRKSLIFQLGLIAYRLFTGKKEQEIKNQAQCQKYVELMRSNCQRQILKVTDDSKIANFVTKMISSNKFQVPTFQQTVNFFCRQATEQRKGQGKNKDYSLQIELEKIHINTERVPTEPKRRIRNCCVKEEPIKELRLEEFKKMGLNSEQQIKTAKKSNLMLPYLSVKNSCSLPRKYNNTTTNRHQLIFSNPRQNQRYHAKSIGYLSTDPS